MTACAVMLAGCISFESAVLIPPVTLSAEDVSLLSSSATTARLDFGLDTSVNESDSLLNVEILPGARVRSIAANGAAAAAGIQVGDIILAIDGIASNHPDVISAIEQSAIKDQFSFTVQRNTLVFEASVVARAVSANQPARELYRVDPLASRAGYSTELLAISGQPNLAAARIVEIFPLSPLPAAGLNEGDHVIAVNGVNLNSAQDLVNRLNQQFPLGDTVVFSVYDGDSVVDRPVQLWDPGRRISRLSLWPLLQYQSSLNPSGSSLSVVDLWLFSLYNYSRVEGEQSHSLLGIFNFTSDYGELTEEQD